MSSLEPKVMRVALPALLAVFALTGCAEDEALYVDKGWVRLPAVEGRPGAAYFTVYGGPTDDTLIRVSTPIAIKSEMHDTMKSGAMMTMTPLQEIPIPAKSKVEFKPGGKHVMLFNLRSTTKPGDTIRLDFVFKSGYQIYFDVPAQAAAAPPPEQKDN